MIFIFDFQWRYSSHNLDLVCYCYCYIVNPIVNASAEDPDEPDSDEEPPELLSQSEDESDFWEEFADPDSEDEVIIVNTTHTADNPIFNENEEGDDMD